MTPHLTDSADYEHIRTWLSDRSGIHYPEYKRDLLRQRLGRVQLAFDYSDLASLLHDLKGGARAEVEMAVLSAASTNHTYFYREADILRQMRDTILPALSAREEIRIWSAACSTGDEVFTIAMLIAEALGPEALERTSILGTDISAPVIARAEQGLVSARQIGALPEDLRRRFLRPLGLGQFEVSAAIRSRCTFRRMNLKTTPYPFRNSFQIVFLRNVLYYFDPADQAATLDAVHEVTEPGGWLITSVTESLRGLPTAWVTQENGIYRRAAP